MQNQNQFGMTGEVGQMDLKMNQGVVSAQIDVSETDELLPGQAVKVVDSAGGVPKVIAADAGDDIFGFIVYNIKNKSFKAKDAVEVAALPGGVMYMKSSGAIARKGQVAITPDVANPRVEAAATGGDTIVGYAYDKAGAADQLIRVVILLPGAAVVVGP